MQAGKFGTYIPVQDEGPDGKGLASIPPDVYTYKRRQRPDFLANDELDWSEAPPPGWEEKEEYDPLADAIECEDYLPPIEGAEEKPKTVKLSSFYSRAGADASHARHDEHGLLTGEPFLGPGSLAELRGKLAKQGKRMPDSYDRKNNTKWGRRSEPSQGGAPRVATFATRNLKTGATKPKFAPYPREEFPLYGRNPVFAPRFGMKMAPSAVNNSRRAASLTAKNQRKSTIKQNTTRSSQYNQNHYHTYLSQHTNR